MGIFLLLLEFAAYSFKVFLISPLIKRFGETFLCITGIIFISIGMLSVAIISQLSCLYIYVINSIWFRFFLPTISTLIVNIVSEDRRGWVLGVNQSVSSLSRIIGPAIAGFLFEFYGKNSPYIFGSIILILFLLIFRDFIKRSAK